MKFNEKLIELRKKQGLSQEELGYKLNVTRQTVSKWELGQTTPEMDKLIEMSKIFNISIDELINESDTTPNQNPIIEEKPIKNKVGREKFLKFLLVGLLVVVLILIVVKISEIASDKFKEIQENKQHAQETQNKIFDTVFDTFDNINQSFDNSNSGHQAIEEDYNEKKEEIISQFEVKKFNQSYELHSGTNKGLFVTNILDTIIKSNKTEDRKITVKYQDIETQEEAEIRNIKQKIKTMNDYDLIFEYDEYGFINQAIIEKL